MTFPHGFRVTTEMLWQGMLLFAGLDAVLVPLLAWRIKNGTFNRMKWPLVIITAVFWSGMWMYMVAVFWESVYHYVFPQWARWVIPPAYGLLFTLICWLFHWLARRLGGRTVLSFCLLGGAWGMITHLLAVYLGIVEKPPVLQEASPVAAVLIAFFEFMFYWCIITSAAAGLTSLWQRTRKAVIKNQAAID